MKTHKPYLSRIKIMPKAIPLFMGLVFLCLPVSLAQAQNCDTVYEMIATLRKPELGSFNLWDHISGDIEKSERIQSAVLLPTSQQVLVGIEQYMAENLKKTVVLKELDRRGRMVWRKNLDIQDVMDFEKVLIWNDEAVVVLNREVQGKKEVWLGFYTFEGDFVRQKLLTNKNQNMEAHDALVTADNSKLLLSVETQEKDGMTAPFTSLLWVDKRGHVKQKRAYRLGTQNRINKIVPFGSDGYIMAGSTYLTDGRSAGWIINATSDGGINWQRQYARGRFAEFKDLGLSQRDKFVALIGDAFPVSGQGRRSAWVMMADTGNGDIAWQRYYRENFDIFSRSLLTLDDGQISILISLEDSNNQDNQDFIRLLSLNPRGVILSSRTYQHGAGAKVNGMILGRNLERIMYGSADVIHQMPEEPNNPDSDVFKDVKSQESWAVAGSANDTYKDPCIRPFTFLP